MKEAIYEYVGGGLHNNISSFTLIVLQEPGADGAIQMAPSEELCLHN